jgi:hypothetical protein
MLGVAVAGRAATLVGVAVAAPGMGLGVEVAAPGTKVDVGTWVGIITPWLALIKLNPKLL